MHTSKAHLLAIRKRALPLAAVISFLIGFISLDFHQNNDTFTKTQFEREQTLSKDMSDLRLEVQSYLEYCSTSSLSTHPQNKDNVQVKYLNVLRKKKIKLLRDGSDFSHFFGLDARKVGENFIIWLNHEVIHPCTIDMPSVDEASDKQDEFDTSMTNKLYKRPNWLTLIENAI